MFQSYPYINLYLNSVFTKCGISIETDQPLLRWNHDKMTSIGEPYLSGVHFPTPCSLHLWILLWSETSNLSNTDNNRDPWRAIPVPMDRLGARGMTRTWKPSCLWFYVALLRFPGLWFSVGIIMLLDHRCLSRSITMLLDVFLWAL